MGAKRVAFVLAIVGVLGACGLESGGPESAQPDAGSPGDASADGASGDTGTDTGDPNADSGSDTGCDSGNGDAYVPEDCTNGADDDCNGLIDCADPACTTGFACVPPLPNGWAWTAYTPNTRPACPTGYNNPVDVEEGINAPPATCGCTCNVTQQPDCTQGNLSLTAGNNGACDDNNNGKQSGPASAGCHQLNKSIQTSGEKMSVTGPAPSGGSCTPTASITPPPSVTYDHQGRTCAYPGSFGGGCSNGDVCAPKAAPLTACVSKLGGSNVCPNGFSVTHLVGSTLQDGRGCNACTCAINASTCTGSGSVTFDTGSNCDGTTTDTITVDAKCHGISDHKWQSYKYFPPNSGFSCDALGGTKGGAAFSDPTTVCCVP